MIKDDNKDIWEVFVTEQASPRFTDFRSDDKTHDAEGEEPGPVRAFSDEESPTSNLDNLISQATVEDNQSDIRRGPGTGATAAQFNAANATGYG